MATLVIAAQQQRLCRIEDLQAVQVQHALDAKVAAIDIVAEKEVRRFQHLAADLEQADQIIVLAVYITANYALASVVGRVFLANRNEALRKNSLAAADRYQWPALRHPACSARLSAAPSHAR